MGKQTLERIRTGVSARAGYGLVTAGRWGTTRSGLGHLYDGTQINFCLRGSGSFLVADQPYRNPESIDFFSDLNHFLFFALKHFERILHRYESFVEGGLKLAALFCCKPTLSTGRGGGNITKVHA
jgi:hypothetical protein